MSLVNDWAEAEIRVHAYIDLKVSGQKFVKLNQFNIQNSILTFDALGLINIQHIIWRSITELMVRSDWTWRSPCLTVSVLCVHLTQTANVPTWFSWECDTDADWSQNLSETAWSHEFLGPALIFYTTLLVSIVCCNPIYNQHNLYPLFSSIYPPNKINKNVL